MPKQRLSKQGAQDLLRHCVENGIVEYHPHFIEALQEDNLTLLDAMPALRSGIVYDEPEFSVRFQQWRYKVEGKEPGGKWLAIVYTFVAEEEALIITGFVKSR